MASTKTTPPAAKTSTPPNTLSGLAGWVEVFKAGTHTDSSGKRFTFGQAELGQMVANHKLGAAPAVLGHPKHDDPAYGWVDDYKVEGASLFAKFKDINPQFDAGVQSGAYRNRSVAVIKDANHGWRVRHVGWLGAVPPAIDGLAPMTFAAGDEDSLEFAAPGYSLVWGLEEVAKLLRNLREQMIAKDGLEAADATLPQWRIDSALESANQARTEFQEERADHMPATRSLYSTDGEPMTTFTQEQLDAAKAEATLAAEANALVQFNASQAELVKLRTERQAEKIAGQIGAWKAAGQVTPAEEPGMAEFMASLESTTGVELTFSASDKLEVKKTPAQFFAEFMAARKPVVKLGSTIGADDSEPKVNGDDASAVAEGARLYMRAQADKGLIVSSSEAVAHVLASGKK